MTVRFSARAGAVLAAALALALLLAPAAAAHFGGGERPAGVWVAELTGAPAGVTATMLQGPVPGVYVQVPAGRTLVVRDASGGALATVDGRSGPAQGSWLDQRLKLPSGPPDHDHGETAVRWTVPAELDGDRVEFAGTTRWVPNTDPEDLRAQAEEDGFPVATAAVGAAGIAAAAGYLVVRRRKAKEQA